MKRFFISQTNKQKYMYIYIYILPGAGDLSGGRKLVGGGEKLVPGKEGLE